MEYPKNKGTGKGKKVRVWGVQDRRSNPRYARPWVVRWQVGDKKFHEHYRTRAEAEHRKSLLLVAQRDGQAFDGESGEPVGWSSESGEVGVHVWVRTWLAKQWDEWQPRTRDSAVEALSRFVPLCVKPQAPDTDGVRTYLKKALTPDFVETGGVVNNDIEVWLDRWCYELGELDRRVLADVDHMLGVGVTGQPLGHRTASRFRTISRSCIRRAVDLELIDKDPWPPIQRGAARRKARRKDKGVDVSLLPNPEIMEQALAAIVTHQPASKRYMVMTAVLYYAGLRPSEVVMLRPQAFDLPQEGWGQVAVTEADISFDEPGEPKTGKRTVPIPPVLVKILNDWIDAGSYADGELIFRTRTGKRPSTSNWSRAWHRALKTIDHKPIRLYDCRHAAATTWLAAGVPLGETARRLGHSVEVLVSTYVGALTGDEQKANQMIEQALNHHR